MVSSFLENWGQQLKIILFFAQQSNFEKKQLDC